FLPGGGGIRQRGRGMGGPTGVHPLRSPGEVSPAWQAIWKNRRPARQAARSDELTLVFDTGFPGFPWYLVRWAGGSGPSAADGRRTGPGAENRTDTGFGRVRKTELTPVFRTPVFPDTGFPRLTPVFRGTPAREIVRVAALGFAAQLRFSN